MTLPTTPMGQPGAAPGQRNLGQMIANLGKQSSLVTQSTVDPRALAAGIKPSFASINFKGKTWGVRYRGTTQQLLAYGQQGEILGAIPSIDVVIVKSALAISKAFYIEKFKEGSFAAPDCWSTNGQVPDLGAAKKQSETCKGCRWDAFGSRTMDDGRKGKACSDNKRLAVVPATDLRNEAYGGPMLLKLTPSGFNGLSELENQLHMQGYVYFGVVMRLSFDYEAAFPKIIFTPVRVLNDDELKVVLELQASDVTERILNEELFEVTGDPQQPVQTEQSAQQAAATPGVSAAPPAQGQAFDAGPIPPFLKRPAPDNPFGQPAAPAAPAAPAPQQAAQLTPEQQRIADLEAQLASARNPAPPPPPEPNLTPEQQRIKDLEDQLAAARSGAAPAVTTTKPRRATGTRSKPVTPAQTGTAALPGPALPFSATAAAPAQPNGNGAAKEVATDDASGDAPPDLDSRIDALLKPSTPTT
jgi:hypothetical protein